MRRLWRASNNYRVTSSPIWIRAFGERERLSGLPLVHRVYFIVHAGESYAKPLMFSKTLSTMDDGRKSRGRVARVSAREQGNEGASARGGVIETSTASGTPCLLTSLFFYHLELGKIFFAFELGPAFALVRRSSLSSAFSSISVSVFFPPGSPSNFTLFDLSNSRNCYSVTDQLPVALCCQSKHVGIFHVGQDRIAVVIS